MNMTWTLFGKIVGFLWIGMIAIDWIITSVRVWNKDPESCIYLQYLAGMTVIIGVTVIAAITMNITAVAVAGAIYAVMIVTAIKWG